jgi:hypothetical protein
MTVRKLGRYALTTAKLAGLLALPGGVLFAIAWLKWRREYRR